MTTQEIAIARSKFYKTIRDFFDAQKFIEVETPILTTIPGMEPHLTPFETTLKLPTNINSQKKEIPLYLNTSPELQMKKLLGKGFEKIYNITKVFRNNEIGGGRHNPEFTMLEWYRTPANYFDLMNDCENLISELAEKFNYSIQKTSWDRKSVQELFLEFTKIDLNKNRTFEELKNSAENKNLDINHCHNWDDIFFKIFLNEIEPNLGKEKPIFVYDYPSSQAALAKKKNNDDFWAERFELYINGFELANAFSELIDSEEQRKRLEEEQTLRKELGKTVFQIDEEFLDSLSKIEKESAGIALGLDRLLMILLDRSSIEEVLLFPMIEMVEVN